MRIYEEFRKSRILNKSNKGRRRVRWILRVWGRGMAVWRSRLISMTFSFVSLRMLGKGMKWSGRRVISSRICRRIMMRWTWTPKDPLRRSIRYPSLFLRLNSISTMMTSLVKRIWLKTKLNNHHSKNPAPSTPLKRTRPHSDQFTKNL